MALMVPMSGTLHYCLSGISERLWLINSNC